MNPSSETESPVSHPENSRRKSFFGRLLLFINLGCAAALLIACLAPYVSPVTFWPLAFFGLSFPVWLGLNLIFAGFWLWRRRRKRMLWSAVAILLTIPYSLDFIQLSFNGSADHPEEKAQLKVLSYNVRVFDYYNHRGRVKTRDAIFTQLTNEDPDILCFQEFYHTDRDGHFETRDTIQKFLRAKNLHEKYTHHMRGQQYFGVVTLSAWPIVNRGSIPFENDPNNFCIYSDLKINEDTVRVYNAHLSSIRFGHEDYEFMNDLRQGEGGELKARSRAIVGRLKRAFEKRAQQTDKIVAHIDESPYPVVICGDFNDTPISYCYEQFNDRLVDAFTNCGSGIGATYIGDFPSFRIDYIFHSDAIHSYDFEILPEELSDHHAIRCMIEVEP